jgi:predicted RNase H-like HicB family nuclease
MHDYAVEGTMHRSVQLEYTAQIWQEGNQYVAHAMPLDIMSSGATPEEARRALHEAVDLFLKTALDVGTLNEILEESGYVHAADHWVSPTWVSVERHETPVII